MPVTYESADDSFSHHQYLAPWAQGHLGRADRPRPPRAGVGGPGRGPTHLASLHAGLMEGEGELYGGGIWAKISAVVGRADPGRAVRPASAAQVLRTCVR